jgi:hypothetical protein
MGQVEREPRHEWAAIVDRNPDAFPGPRIANNEAGAEGQGTMRGRHPVGIERRSGRRAMSPKLIAVPSGRNARIGLAASVERRSTHLGRSKGPLTMPSWINAGAHSR